MIDIICVQYQLRMNLIISQRKLYLRIKPDFWHNRNRSETNKGKKKLKENV